jgi:hypothetical protein
MVVEKEQEKADRNKTFEFHCCRAKKTKFHQPIEPYTKKMTDLTPTSSSRIK